MPGRRLVLLLRAVNVGGTSVVTMARLKAAVERAGMREVETYIQSGNVVFTTSAKDPTPQIRRALSIELGLEPDLFLFTPTQLNRALAAEPFQPAAHEATQKDHLMFLSAHPKPDAIQRLEALKGTDYHFAVKGEVLYWGYPRVWAGKRRTIDFERVLGVRGTSRTWRVVEELVRRAAAKSSG